jgi:hypothetical protein
MRNETAAEFAKRVKQAIVRRIGLIDVEWDGFLKRHRISSKFIQQRQKAHAMVSTPKNKKTCKKNDESCERFSCVECSEMQNIRRKGVLTLP